MRSDAFGKMDPVRRRSLTRLFLRYRSRSDGRALARVFDALAPELLGIASHLVRDAQLAEDLVQATFLAAIERADAFDPERELKPWLYGILVREAAKERRRVARHAGTGIPDERTSGSELERMTAEELPRVVRETLERAPRKHRELLAPLLLEGRTPSELARELGRSPGTVRMQVHRALEWLRRSLPAGVVAGAGVSSLPTRGLAAVRGEVLRAAGLSTPVSGASWIAIGGVAMSKAMVGVVGCLALGLLWWSRSSPRAGEARVAALDPPPIDVLDSIGTRAPSAVAPEREVVVRGWSTPPRIRAEVAAPARSALLRGRVLDAEGRAVAGARVLGGRSEQSADELATSDVEGRFALAPEEEGPLFVHALAEGHAPSLVLRAFPRASEAPELVLALRGPEAKLELFVLDADEHPLSGAGVRVGDRAMPAFLPGGEPAWTAPAREAHTDADGRAVFGSLPEGSTDVRAQLDGYVRVKRQVDLGAGSSRTLRFVLPRGWAVEGRVLDRASRAVAGVRLWAHPPSPGRAFAVSAESDADGRFVLAGIPEPVFVVEAFAKDRGHAQSPTLEAEVGRAAVWNAVLVSNPAVTGRVVDERGGPLAEWYVLLHRPDSPETWHASARTASDGSFELRDPPEGELHLSLRTPALWDGGPVLTYGAVEAGERDLVIRVPDDRVPSAGFEARARYRSGAAAPRAVLRFRKEGDDLAWSAEVDPSDGAIRKDRLRPGPYTFELSGEGLVFEPLGSRELRPNESLDLGELELASRSKRPTTGASRSSSSCAPASNSRRSSRSSRQRASRCASRRRRAARPSSA